MNNTPTPDDLARVLTPDKLSNPLDGLSDAEIDTILDTIYHGEQFPDELALSHVTESGNLQLTPDEWPVGTRALVSLSPVSPDAAELAVFDLEEIAVVEWSPSGNYVYVRASDRLRSGWREPVIAARLVEVLTA